MATSQGYRRAPLDAATLEVRTNLRGVLADLKETDTRLWRQASTAVKGAGDAVVKVAEEILATENPGTVASKQYRKPLVPRRGGYRRGPRARELAGARLVGVTARNAAGRSRGMREEVSAGLRTRISQSKARGTASVKITSARAVKSLPAKALNRTTFRHPVFGRGYSEQKGLRYFTRGIQVGGKQARADLLKAIDDAGKALRSNPPLD